MFATPFQIQSRDDGMLTISVPRLDVPDARTLEDTGVTDEARSLGQKTPGQWRGWTRRAGAALWARISGGRKRLVAARLQLAAER